jgi:hypothetical protein
MSTTQDRGDGKAHGYTALTRTGEFVESGFDLNALVTVVRDEILERGHGDVCVWEGQRLAAVCFDEGSTLVLHRLQTGGIDALKAAFDCLKAGLPASARQYLSRANLTDHPASTIKLMMVGLDLLESGHLAECPGLVDRLGREIGGLQPADLTPWRQAPRAPGSQR